MKVEANPYSDIKMDNRKRVFNLIREEEISKPEVSRRLGLSIPTAIQHINQLEEDGCIKEGGSIGHTGGRRAKSYTVNGEHRYAVGLYIFKEKVIVAAVDFCGRQVGMDTVDCVFSMQNDYYRKLSELLEEKIVQWKIEEDRILGVGVALPGLVTEDGRHVYYGKTLNFTGISVQELGKYIPYPCRLYNEADAAGCAEIAFGKDIKDAFYISLGERVGGVVLIDGRIYGGEYGKAGKVAHLTLVPGGKACYCGRRGCFDTLCNASVLKAVCEGEIQDFFEKVEKGDRVCVDAWDTYMQSLAEAVVNVRMLFDSKVIVGGVVRKYMEPYFPQLLQKATELDTFDNPADYLSLSRVKDGAAALGSALPFIHELWQNI